MIDSLRQLSDQLSAKRYTAVEAARLIGTPLGSAVLHAQSVHPADPVFASATVVAESDGSFSYAELMPAHEVKLSELIAAFGEPSRPPKLHPGRAETRVFALEKARLIAALSEDETVNRLTLQPNGA